MNREILNLSFCKMSCLYISMLDLWGLYFFRMLGCSDFYIFVLCSSHYKLWSMFYAQNPVNHRWLNLCIWMRNLKEWYFKNMALLGLCYDSILIDMYDSSIYVFLFFLCVGFGVYIRYLSFDLMPSWVLLIQRVSSSVFCLSIGLILLQMPLKILLRCRFTCVLHILQASTFAGVHHAQMVVEACWFGWKLEIITANGSIHWTACGHKSIKCSILVMYCLNVY